MQIPSHYIPNPRDINKHQIPDIHSESITDNETETGIVYTKAILYSTHGNLKISLKCYRIIFFDFLPPPSWFFRC